MGLGKNLSAGMFGHWTNHFQCMGRWKDRALAEIERPYGDESQYVVDFTLAYFVWCHSLREWFINGSILSKDVLDADLARFPQWKICRDVANRCRHYDLRMNPTDKDFTFGREFDPFATPSNGRPREKWFLVFVDSKYDVAETIRATFKMWLEIIASHNLDPTSNGRFP